MLIQFFGGNCFSLWLGSYTFVPRAIYKLRGLMVTRKPSKTWRQTKRNQKYKNGGSKERSTERSLLRETNKMKNGMTNDHPTTIREWSTTGNNLIFFWSPLTSPTIPFSHNFNGNGVEASDNAFQYGFIPHLSDRKIQKLQFHKRY